MSLQHLIERLAWQEAQVQQATIFAPYVRGGAIRVRIEGLIRTFRPVANTEEGWGYFRPVDVASVVRVGAASREAIAAYLGACEAQVVHLAAARRGTTWLAVPEGTAMPVAVHLVERGDRFDTVRARFDGASWWYEAPERRSDSRRAEALRHAYRTRVDPSELRVGGATPALRQAYALAFQGRARADAQRATHRLGDALTQAGGSLESHQDRGDHWLVTWRTPDGERHTSAIDKSLTVLSAGICLSDQDRDFDLTSLVGVVQDRPDWMRDWE